MQFTDELLTTLVAEVTKSPKYASVSIDLVREIGLKELVKTKNIKEAIKATRNKIHQVGSAYQETPIPYTSWLEALTKLPKDIRAPETINFIRACLPLHASTKERLPFIETFFQQTLAPIQPVESIFDLLPYADMALVMSVEPGFYGQSFMETAIAKLEKLAAAIGPDGSGGAVVAWIDRRSGLREVYSQRIGSDGAVLWTVDGVAVCVTGADEIEFSLASDGSGAVYAWREYRMYYPQELDALLRYNRFCIAHKWGDFQRHPFGPDSELQIVVCGRGSPA